MGLSDPTGFRRLFRRFFLGRELHAGFSRTFQYDLARQPFGFEAERFATAGLVCIPGNVKVTALKAIDRISIFHKAL
jgi:hypothetical protein